MKVSLLRPTILGIDLLDRGGRLVWSSGEKASLFLAPFNSKQYRISFKHSHFCDLCPVLRSVAFRTSLVHSLLLGLDLYGGNDPDGMFPLYYNRLA